MKQELQYAVEFPVVIIILLPVLSVISVNINPNGTTLTVKINDLFKRTFFHPTKEFGAANADLRIKNGGKDNPIICICKTTPVKYTHNYRNGKPMEDQALEDFIEIIVSASNKGVSAVRNASGEPNWSFGQSLFFSSTVVTTIGYGHVTPLSKAGKCFCIIFGVLGIPLTMMLLTALVDRLLVPSTLFLQYLNSKLGHLYQPFYIRLFHLWILLSLLIIFFWLIPASVFAFLEPEWDMFDAMYYCFISLTTIGLGDYIPGDAPEQENRALYKILTTVYLYVGLVFLIFTLTVFYDIPQLNFGIFFLMQADEEQLTNVDPEKIRLQTPGSIAPKYTQQLNVTQGRQHAVVKVKARRDDSPSPEETTPVHTIP